MTNSTAHEGRFSKNIAIIAVIITILGTSVSAVTGIRNIILSSTPAITVQNKLMLPIIVTINRSYRNIIHSGETKRSTLLSDQEFPAQVQWKIQRNKNNKGEPIGEELGDELKLVDKGARITVDNQIKLIAYFYPVVWNNTDQQCTIVVNDGLSIEHVIGVTNPHRLTNVSGYFQFASNSNLTVQCPDKIYWHGERTGKKGNEKIDLQVGSGKVEIKIP
jgi:hypothetical protein